MFIVDFYTLQTVYSLYFTDHIILYGTYTFDFQNVVWVNRTFCQFITGFQHLSVCNLDSGSVRDQVCLGFSAFFIGNYDFSFLLGIFDCNFTRNLCDNGKSFRLSCLEQLLDTRKTLCDIATGNTTTMESTHGQLCTRLTDGLCGDDTYRLTNLNSFSCCHVGTITFCTDTNFTFTAQNRTDLDLVVRFAFCIDTFAHDLSCTFRCDHVVCFYKHITIFIFDCLAGETSCDTFLQTFDFFFSVCEFPHIHTRNLISAFRTIHLTNNQLLRYIYQTSGQVTGIGGTKSGIGHTFSSSMGGHEIFQYIKTFTEV